MSALPSFVNEESVWSPYLACATEIFSDLSSRQKFPQPIDREYVDGLVDGGLWELASFLTAGDFRNGNQIMICAAAVEACLWLSATARTHIARSLRRLVIDASSIRMATVAVAAALAARSKPPIGDAIQALKDIGDGLHAFAEAKTEADAAGR